MKEVFTVAGGAEARALNEPEWNAKC